MPENEKNVPWTFDVSAVGKAENPASALYRAHGVIHRQRGGRRLNTHEIGDVLNLLDRAGWRLVKAPVPPSPVPEEGERRERRECVDCGYGWRDAEKLATRCPVCMKVQPARPAPAEEYEGREPSADYRAGFAAGEQSAMAVWASVEVEEPTADAREIVETTAGLVLVGYEVWSGQQFREVVSVGPETGRLGRVRIGTEPSMWDEGWPNDHPIIVRRPVPAPVEKTTGQCEHRKVECRHCGHFVDVAS